MSSRVFLLPDLGEGLTEAEIVAWRVAVGDVIEVDQSVVEVETAKAVVEVPCPFAGRVVELHGEPGESRPVGQPLVTVEPVAEAVYREEERAGSGSGNVLVGYGTGHGAGARRRRRAAVARSAAPAASAAAPSDGDVQHDVPGVVASGGAPLVISPLVRKLARDHHVDVATLHGSGPGGIVRRADVEAAIAPAPAAVTAVDGEHVVPLRGVRRAVAEKLSRSRREIPDVTIWVDVDATPLLEARTSINAARPDQPVSLLALLARACLSGLRRYPELNARVQEDRIVQSSRVNLGVAAQTDRGLIVPVIADAQAMTTTELAAALTETTAAARAGTLPPARLTGGTFTLNNYGVFGIDGSTPIINLPEAALVGVGRIVDKPWVVDGQLCIRKVVQLTLTFDHRVCDGGVAGGFLRHVADCVETPALLI
jgi:pyruvate dehydrogenase E2 component (dihydrolipoamide acetyltransferase)